MKRPSLAIWISVFFLGLALIGLSMVLISNASYHAGIRMTYGVIEHQKEVCLEVNESLQRYERARDCTAYGKILDSIQDQQRL